MDKEFERNAWIIGRLIFISICLYFYFTMPKISDYDEERQRIQDSQEQEYMDITSLELDETPRETGWYAD